MKDIKYLFLMLAAMFVFAACSQDPEEYKLSENRAAVIAPHGGVLVYPNSLAEDVTFTWAASKFMDGDNDITYTIYGIDANGSNFAIGTTNDLKYTLTHSEFNNYLLSNGFAANETSAMQIFVKAKNSSGEEVDSDPISFNVQPLDADLFVAPVLNDVADFVMTDATSQTKVKFEWVAPTMEVNSTVKYTLTLNCNDTEKEYTDISALDYEITYEALNDWLLAAGVTEGDEAVFTATLTATSNYGSTISSNTINVNATTYIIPYPADLGVTGSHQGWSPESAPRLAGTGTRGEYGGYLQMDNSGNEVEFKFTVATWSDPNYGGTSSGYNFTLDGSDNLKIASGIYKWTVSLKNSTATAIPLTNVGLIGSFTGWGSQAPMTFNTTTKKWEATITLTADDEFKVRFDDNWDYNLGGNINDLSHGGDNIKPGVAGTYDVTLDLTNIPIVLTYTLQ